jgi:hypothetical protein
MSNDKGQSSNESQISNVKKFWILKFGIDLAFGF